MDYLVLREGGGELADHQQLTGTAHLAVDGAPETLCASPVGRFEWVDDLSQHDHGMQWCWVCTSTAHTRVEPRDIGL